MVGDEGVGVNEFNFDEGQKSDIKRYLTSEIEKHLNKQDLADPAYQEAAKRNMLRQIGIFIKLLELDTRDLKLVGRNVFKLSQFSANVAERFDTLLGITVTPTRGNNFSKILTLCFECAHSIEAGAESDIYDYAKAGIDQIKTEQDPYRMNNLLPSEKYVGGGEYHSKSKKRSSK